MRLFGKGPLRATLLLALTLPSSWTEEAGADLPVCKETAYDINGHGTWLCFCTYTKCGDPLDSDGKPIKLPVPVCQIRTSDEKCCLDDSTETDENGGSMCLCKYTYCSDPVDSDGSLIKLSATVCEARSHSEGCGEITSQDPEDFPVCKETAYDIDGDGTWLCFCTHFKCGDPVDSDGKTKKLPVSECQKRTSEQKCATPYSPIEVCVFYSIVFNDDDDNVRDCLCLFTNCGDPIYTSGASSHKMKSLPYEDCVIRWRRQYSEQCELLPKPKPDATGKPNPCISVPYRVNNGNGPHICNCVMDPCGEQKPVEECEKLTEMIECKDVPSWQSYEHEWKPSYIKPPEKIATISSFYDAAAGQVVPSRNYIVWDIQRRKG